MIQELQQGVQAAAWPREGGVLILTGAFGTGHTSAADALIAQLAQRSELPAARVDFLEQLLPKLSTVIYSTFHRIVAGTPELFNYGYQRTSQSVGPARLLLENPAARRAVVEGFDRLMWEYSPQLVVSVVPFAGRLYELYRRETGCEVPLCSCITDAIAHAGWLAEGCERYLVATEGVRRGLERLGVAGERIAVTGVPVRPAFLQQREVPHREGLPRQLLIMGGGWGLMNHDDGFFDALERLEGVETTLLTGNNRALREQIKQRHPAIRAVGYTDRVHEYMARADLLLTKAGGVTLFEAIHSGLPLLVEAPFLEQERCNANTVRARGIGRVLQEGENPIQAVHQLLLEGGADRYRENLEQLRTELNALCPAEELLSMLPLAVGAYRD